MDNFTSFYVDDKGEIVIKKLHPEDIYIDPDQSLSIIGMENIETFVIYKNTIGVRNKWIKFKDSSPIIRGKYYICYFDPERYYEPEMMILKITESIYDGDIVWSSDDGEHEYKLEDVVYCMELPKKPKENE